MEGVLRAITAAAASPGNTARKSLQDFTNCVAYGTTSFWKAEQSMEAVASLLARLGLRNPSEPTVQMATAVYLIAVHGVAGALALSCDSGTQEDPQAQVQRRPSRLPPGAPGRPRVLEGDPQDHVRRRLRGDGTRDMPDTPP